MHVKKPAIWAVVLCSMAAMITPTPVLAMLLGPGLGKGMRTASPQSSVILVQRRRRRSRGSDKGAAAAAGAAAVIGIIGGLIAAERRRAIDECLARHSDVDVERGVWYDRRGREHPCP